MSNPRAMTLWLTGLSGSGKSTLARELEASLRHTDHRCCVLDGDDVRRGLSRDLGFGRNDRCENVRRIAEVARLLNDGGHLVVASIISPYRCDRGMAREIVGADRFVEVFVDAPLGVCEARDPKGLYRRARCGAIDAFTGVSAPYERPDAPDLVLTTAGHGVRQCVDRLLLRIGACRLGE